MSPSARACLRTAIDRCGSPGDFFPVLRRICEDLGFDHFNLAYRAPVLNRPSRFVTLTSFPEALCRAYDDSGFLSADPVVRRAAEAQRPFTWHELDWTANPRSAELHAALVAHGIGFGLSIPLRGPGHQVALVTFAHRECPVSAEALPGMVDRARVAACRVFDRLVELPGFSRAASGAESLTEREAEFLRLSAMGHPLKVIHAMMNIKQSTATYFTNRIVRKLGARRFRMAVIQAQLNGVIDLVGHPERNVGTGAWLHEAAFLSERLPTTLPEPRSRFLPTGG